MIAAAGRGLAAGLGIERARTPCPWTKPAVASLLTGLPPAVHTAETDEARLPRQAVTVTEALTAAGYRTAVFSANHYVSAHFAVTQGTGHAVDPLTGRGLARFGPPPRSLLGHVAIGLFYKRLGWTEPAADEDLGPLGTDFLRWLDRADAARPWFAYLHFMEPHYPYSPPPRFAKRFGTGRGRVVRPGRIAVGLAPFYPGEEVSDADLEATVAAYDAEIAHWDHRFGLLLWALEARGRLDGLVVAVVGDHGEAFFDHGTWGHGQSIHEEELRVPLVVRVPGTPPGRHRGAVEDSGTVRWERTWDDEVSSKTLVEKYDHGKLVSEEWVK